MRERAPFRAEDVEEIDEKFFSRATAVVAMIDVHRGNRSPSVIGLRHDCDAGHSLATAVKMAAWEADRGYRSTYYLLHTSPYWEAEGFGQAVYAIACYGHEIGIHADALAESFKTGEDPDLILDEALAQLRSYGIPVRGVAGHGNPLCNRDRAEGEITFANDEQFTECARPQEGLPDRWVSRGKIRMRLRPRPLADFGLDYEALVLALPFTFRISDSGGKWLNPGFEETADKFDVMRRATMTDALADPKAFRQCHFLQHPDWYREAFVGARRAVAA